MANSGRARIALVVLVALAAGFFGGRASLIASGVVEPSNGRIRLKPGPWGDVEYLPITIAPPRKLLRVQGLEDEALLWYFSGDTRAGFRARLAGAGVEPELVDALSAPGILSEHPQGVRVEPTCAMVRELGAGPRRLLFESLANTPENGANRWEFFSENTRSFGKFGVSRSALGSLEDVSVHFGRYTVTYAMSCVLAEMDDQEEKVGLIKALSQQNSMLVRVRIGPDTDIQALAAYWGRGMWTTDVEAILESVQKRPDGGVVNILEMLPPLPGALLHSYPAPHNFLAGPEVIKNCSWTAFNFFRDAPRDEFSEEAFVLKTLAEDYLPVLSDPRYGDIAVFLAPGGKLQHVAVYLAGDLYFTKNGDNPWHPWVYSTEKDLLETFSFGLPEGKAPEIHYFRNKVY